MAVKHRGINLLRVDVSAQERDKKLWLLLTVSGVLLVLIAVVNLGLFGYTVILGQKIQGLDEQIKVTKDQINSLSKVESLQTVLVNQVRATGEILQERGDVATPLEILLTAVNGKTNKVLVGKVVVENDQTMTFNAKAKNSQILNEFLNELVDRLINAGYTQAQVGDISETVDGALDISVSYAN